MVKSKDEIIAAINTALLESTSDEALALIEDVADTLDSYEEKIGEDWKSKYEENDAEWRQRYRDRFVTGADPDDLPALDEPAGEPDQEPEVKSFDELFSTDEEN